MIYFKNPDTTSLLDLFISGFSYDRNSSWKSFVKTYSDPECTQQECHAARRSFGDLFIIAQTYFPNCTKEEVAYAISEVPGICCFKCFDIEKYVFMIDSGRGCFGDNDGYPRGLNTCDNFSFYDFLKLLNK